MTSDNVFIIIDGDNCPLEKYLNSVEPSLIQKYGTFETPLLVCQSNIIIKYKRGRNFNINYLSSNLNQRNSADARIIYEAGKLVSNGYKVIIVSNDNIYREIESDSVEICTFDSKSERFYNKNTDMEANFC